jgi:hypothetical protein
VFVIWVCGRNVAVVVDSFVAVKLPDIHKMIGHRQAGASAPLAVHHNDDAAFGSAQRISV